jgi:hypothetical protein
MLKVYKIFPDAVLPNYQTKLAACFDLAAYLPATTSVRIWAGKHQRDYDVQHDGENGKNYITIATTGTGTDSNRIDL